MQMNVVRSLFFILLVPFLIAFVPKQGVSQSIKIGKQIWAEKNLAVSVFKNGDTIPHAPTKEAWVEASINKQPAWCYYDNDPQNGAKLGKLYNFYAVNDSRGLAPEGWSLPTINDIKELMSFYGGKDGELQDTDRKYYHKTLNQLKRKFRRSKNDSLFFSEHNYESHDIKEIRTIIPSDQEMIVSITDKISNANINEIEQAKVGDVVGPIYFHDKIGIAKITDIKTVEFATVRHILLSNTSDNKSKTQAKADSIVEVIKAQDNFEEMVRLFSEDPGSIERGGVYKDFMRGVMVPNFNDFSFDKPEGSIGTVSSAFGIHIIEVLNQYKEERPEVIFIKKEMRAGSSAATRMKDKKQWILYPIHGVTKNSFKAPPAGYRSGVGEFIGKDSQAVFWLNTILEENKLAYIGLISGVDNVIINAIDQPAGGLSIRCIKLND